MINMHNFRYTPKKTNDQPLKDILKQLANSRVFRTKLKQTKVVELWHEMMGPTISSHTQEIQLTKKGKLYLSIRSASLRQELSYGKEKIKKNLNEELGEAYIKEVVII